MHKFSNNALWNNPNLLIGNMFDLYLFYCLKHVIEQNLNEELILPKKFNWNLNHMAYFLKLEEVQFET